MDQIPSVNVTDLTDDALVVDVREPDEWAAGHAPGALHIPLGEVPARLEELPETDGPLPVICRSGNRSLRAAQWLAQQGFDVANVEGGMRAWGSADKPMVGEGAGDPHVL